MDFFRTKNLPRRQDGAPIQTFRTLAPGWQGPPPRRCQFIAGDDFLGVIAEGGDPYCGAALAPGSSFCPERHARCWVNPRDAVPGGRSAAAVAP